MNARAAKPLESSVTLLLLTIVCAFLAGCSSFPSSRDAEREIQNRINQESEGRVKLVKFQKMDGTQGELMGFKIYALEFNAEIEFAENCKWVIGFMGTQLSFRTTKLPPKSQDGLAAFMEASQNPGMQVSKGQHVQLAGVVRFVKKENGWSVEGVDITKGDVENAPKPATRPNPIQQSKGAGSDVQQGRWTVLGGPASSERQSLQAEKEAVQRVQNLYRDGYDNFKFGMKPEELFPLIGMNPANWASLPIAREYGGADVRYCWQYVNKLQNVPRLAEGKCSDSSYVCFLFFEGQLFSTSIRFLNDSSYSDHRELFNNFAARLGIDPRSSEGMGRLTVRTSTVLLEGKLDAQAARVDFIKAGSPKAENTPKETGSSASAPAAAAAKLEEKPVELQPITENTEAWEFEVVSHEELPPQSSLPAFSKDFSKLAYVARRQLVVRAVVNSKPLKSFRLPADVHSLAFSPDEKKIACLISGGDIDAHLLFVDLETEKVTPIKLTDLAWGEGVNDSRVTWPNDTTLYIHHYSWMRAEGRLLNLDTLKTTSLRDDQWDWLGKDLQVSNHKKVVPRIGDYIRGSEHSLVLDSIKVSYARVIVFDVGKGIMDGGNAKRYGWSPDLRFFYEWKPSDDGGVCTIYSFGLRPKPRFQDDFELRGLQSAFSENQRQVVADALSKHKQIWFTVFHPNKNPLSQRTIGPDRSVALGRGLVTSLGDTASVTYGVEYLPICDGDVAADFWIREGDNFRDVWATVARKP
jgi:hypothetical protein